MLRISINHYNSMLAVKELQNIFKGTESKLFLLFKYCTVK